MRPLVLMALLFSAGDAGLDRARRWVETDLRYQDGIELLSRILIRSGLSEPERVEAYRLLGIAYVALGKERRAEAALWELFRLRPSLVIDPELSPKVIAVFERARARARVAPRLLDVTVDLDGDALHFGGELHDPNGEVREVVLHVRAPDGTYRLVPMHIAGRRIWAKISNPAEETVQYYLVGTGVDGRTVARLATPEGPSTVIVRRAAGAAAPAPWYATWWIWAGAALLAGAAGGTAYLLVRDNEPQVPSGSLGPAIVLD